MTTSEKLMDASQKLAKLSERAKEAEDRASAVRIEKTGNGVASRTVVALTQRGRAALGTYAEALRGLLDGLPAAQ
jgi:hypothetical protein